VGALAVHELRYRIAFGDDASSTLASSGHGYLGLVTPVVALVAMSGLASLVQHMASGDGSLGERRGRIWLALSAGLLAIFCVQELFESLLATGHPDGLEGMFGDGGWLALPLSMTVGGIAVAFVRLVAAQAFRGVATSFIVLWPLEAKAASQLGETPRPRPPLLRHLAGRAPPLFA